METREIKIRLDLPLMSRARPRFGKGRSYLPASYRQWKQQARQLLRMFWEAHGLETLDQFELHVEAHGPGRCDADNLIGSILDAGLPDKTSGFRGCWRDDRVTVIPVISFRWVRSKQQFWDVQILTRVA